MTLIEDFVLLIADSRSFGDKEDDLPPITLVKVIRYNSIVLSKCHRTADVVKGHCWNV